MRSMRCEIAALTGLLFALSGCGAGCGKKGAERAAGPVTPEALAAAPLATAGPALRDDPAPLPEGIKRGDTCTLPLWLSSPAVGNAPTVVSGDLAGFAGDFQPVEGSGASAWGGRDAFYRIDLQAGDSYRFTLRSKSGSLGLFGVRACAAPEQGLLFGETAGKPVFYTAPTDGPIWLGVDAKGDYTAAGSYELEVFRLPSPGATASGPEGAGISGGSDLCDKAPPLVPSKRILGNSRGATTQVTQPFKGSGLSWAGPDHFFSLAVKRGATYQLELDTLGQFAGGLYLLADCGQVAGSALAETAASSPLVWTSDRDGSVVVGVDSSGQGAGGAYQLAVLERPAK